MLSTPTAALEVILMLVGDKIVFTLAFGRRFIVEVQPRSSCEG
jgi:hypothetical protein